MNNHFCSWAWLDQLFGYWIEQDLDIRTCFSITGFAVGRLFYYIHVFRDPSHYFISLHWVAVCAFYKDVILGIEILRYSDRLISHWIKIIESFLDVKRYFQYFTLCFIIRINHALSRNQSETKETLGCAFLGGSADKDAIIISMYLRLVKQVKISDLKDNISPMDSLLLMTTCLLGRSHLIQLQIAIHYTLKLLL